MVRAFSLVAVVALLSMLASRPAWAPAPVCPTCSYKKSEFTVAPSPNAAKALGAGKKRAAKTGKDPVRQAPIWQAAVTREPFGAD